MQLNKKILRAFAFMCLIGMITSVVHAEIIDTNEDPSMDRIQLVTQQIVLLKSRFAQAERELKELQRQHDSQISQLAIEKASKNLLDRASLDISVSKSNRDTVDIELTDAQQTIIWLEKNIQEIENQINVAGIFGKKIARNERVNTQELNADLVYQKKLLLLEKDRVKYLQDLQNDTSSILQLKKERFNRLNTMLKSHRILHMKKLQVKDELIYQQLQNNWLQQLNVLYIKLAKIDPSQDKDEYANTERDIFYANESAHFAYSQALVARYNDQIQQMKFAVLKGNSISLLNEISDQVQVLTKQIERLDTVLKSRIGVMDKHIKSMSVRKNESEQIKIYISRLESLDERYHSSTVTLGKLDKSLVDFRVILDQALQTELSSRQGLPTFGFKMLLDLGKETLLVPPLAFQVVKSLSANVLRSIESASIVAWSVFAFIESLVIFAFFFTRKLLTELLARPSEWRERINLKWLSLQCLQRNYADMFVMGNVIAVFYFFGVPPVNFLFVVYLSFVWVIFKSLMIVSRLSLVETTHDTTGHDVKLYKRLKWVIFVGAIVTAMTVFVHQLPLIYEVKTLCDRLFLFCSMIFSLFLLRSWDVVPQLILSHMESGHVYFERSVRLLGILIPVLMLGNSIIGLLGFVNLVLTVSWYEGIFLLVLMGYLLLRGLLTDGLEQLSRLVIQYANNGWLWTEAFIKPVDKVLRIALFFVAWVVLFIFYGWDKQSPIVERLTRLLHYKLASVLGTTITPLNMTELLVVISVFYWTAKWTREFVYRLLSSRTNDMGIRNSIAILSQYSVIVLAVFISLRVLGIDLRALIAVAGLFAFGVGMGLRDLANNFACGFLILLERPLRVGDIVTINNFEGEVTNIGSRAVTLRTWDNMETLVPNTEIFNKSFTNWTAQDNIVRSMLHIKISRYDNPHDVKLIIQQALSMHKEVLSDPPPEVYLKEMNDVLMDFELRYYVNIRQVKSRTSVMSQVLMSIWDVFGKHGIKPPYPQQEIFIRNSEMPVLGYQTAVEKIS